MLFSENCGQLKIQHIDCWHIDRKKKESSCRHDSFRATHHPLAPHKCPLSRVAASIYGLLNDHQSNPHQDNCTSAEECTSVKERVQHSSALHLPFIFTSQSSLYLLSSSLNFWWLLLYFFQSFSPVSFFANYVCTKNTLLSGKQKKNVFAWTTSNTEMALQTQSSSTQYNFTLTFLFIT